MGTEILECADFRVVTPEITVAEGCPVLTKLRNVVTKKGVAAVVEWPLLNAAGKSLDISDCFPTVQSQSEDGSLSESGEEGRIAVRLTTCDERGPILEVDGVVKEAATGTIRFEVPSSAADYAGIYRMSIGVYSAGDKLLFVDDGLLSVERSAFGDPLEMRGPPTLAEIRMAMRDSAGENNLLRNVEFSNDEIIFSIVRPIADWNETPPPVAPMTCNTFPWRHNWLKAVCGYLLQTAGFHYVRNKLSASHGGLQVNDKDKDNAYFALAQKFLDDWKLWLQSKKVQINIDSCYGGVDSIYGGYGSLF